MAVSTGGKLRLQESRGRTQRTEGEVFHSIKVGGGTVSLSASEGEVIQDLAEFTTSHPQVADELGRCPAQEAFGDQRRSLLRGASNLVVKLHIPRGDAAGRYSIDLVAE